MEAIKATPIQSLMPILHPRLFSPENERLEPGTQSHKQFGSDYFPVQKPRWWLQIPALHFSKISLSIYRIWHQKLEVSKQFPTPLLSGRGWQGWSICSSRRRGLAMETSCRSVSYHHGSLRLPHPPRYQVFQEIAGLTKGILNHPGRFFPAGSHLQPSPTFFKKGRHDLNHPPPGKNMFDQQIFRDYSPPAVPEGLHCSE